MKLAHHEIFAMLSRLLVAYTYDFDAALVTELGPGSGPPPSLAMWANVLQFVSDDGLPMKELPPRCGIAKATVKSMVSCLKRHGWVAVDAGGIIRLTARGLEAKRAFPKAKAAVERQWAARWGRQTVDALRSALEDASERVDGRFPQYPMPAPHRGALPTGE